MFTMSFNFNREEMGPEQINAALATMPLSDLRIRGSKGFLTTRQTFGPNEELLSTTYSYGFDSIAFECRQDEGEEAHVYQIDVATFPKGEYDDSEQYHDVWCDDHPDRCMRIMQQISFDVVDVYVVLHHAREI